MIFFRDRDETSFNGLRCRKHELHYHNKKQFKVKKAGTDVNGTTLTMIACLMTWKKTLRNVLKPVEIYHEIISK